MTLYHENLRFEFITKDGNLFIYNGKHVLLVLSCQIKLDVPKAIK